MQHERFHYPAEDDLLAELQKLRISLPLTKEASPLLAPIDIGDHHLANRVVFQPMEGTDGELDGSVGELTKRRYIRFAKAGPGLIWFEAVATCQEMRASRHQLMLTEENADSYRYLLDEIRETSLKVNGYSPLLIMQATVSGRYAKPQGFPQPRIAYLCPPLEDTPLTAEAILSDDELDAYAANYENAALLCQKAGFDGMDIKCCHRYLASELLSAYNREGKYGGSFENRIRFLLNCYEHAQHAVTKPGFFLTSRLNIYDGFSYPNGFGVKDDGTLDMDLSEPLRLITRLRDLYHIPFINITMGNPYRNPHVNRPYDHGNYIPPEHPLEGISRMMHGVSSVQHAFPDLPVIGSAFSYLRQYAGELAAGMIMTGSCSMAGFGREALAYPEFIHDLQTTARMDPGQVCVTCGGCATLLRSGKPAGCVVRDREVYHL